MNHSSENNLKLLCTDTNKLKDTYYGSIHRANFSINGEKGDWDILRISIPFAPLKEAEFMQRFHVSREELPGFYASFEKAVVRHSSLIKELSKKTSLPLTSYFLSSGQIKKMLSHRF